MIRELNDYLAKADIDWAICGGDAIDMFVGKQTRDHKDIDVAVFWDEREQLLTYLLQGNWRIFEPENGLLREVTNLQNDYRKKDNLWCILNSSSAYYIEKDHGDFYQITTSRKQQVSLDFIEFLFNDRDGNSFLYKRNHNIKLGNAILHDFNGIPFLAPEMVLLYKSVFTRYLDSSRPEDISMVNCYRHDFNMSLPLLTIEQKYWLKNALLVCYPDGHEWLTKY